MAQLSEPTRLSSAPKVPETVMKPHRVPAGLLALEDVPSAEPTVAATSQCPPEPSPIVLSAGLGSNAGIAASTLVFTAGSSCSSATPVQLTLAPPQEMLIQQLSRKRAADSLPQNPIANKRARRTCRKCAIQYCNGSRNVDLCQNKCRDCGKSGSDKSCVGRNPKYPSQWSGRDDVAHSTAATIEVLQNSAALGLAAAEEVNKKVKNHFPMFLVQQKKKHIPCSSTTVNHSITSHKPMARVYTGASLTSIASVTGRNQAILVCWCDSREGPTMWKSSTSGLGPGASKSKSCARESFAGPETEIDQKFEGICKSREPKDVQVTKGRNETT
ncbi:hypothetical protein R3P38DRAFT_2784848 [Favolaschia claudopus]|uniref:Uncharacterized protein n=1 Tax=Favolaschia claudopus TaxID=2862362 RepID=A0AAW0AXZ3_9AGAR